MSHLERHQNPPVDVQTDVGGHLQPGSCYTQINYYGASRSSQAEPSPYRTQPRFPWLLIGGTGFLFLAGVFWWMSPQQQLVRTQQALVQTQAQLSAAQVEVQRIRLCVEGQ